MSWPDALELTLPSSGLLERLHDRRRTKARPFFAGPLGPHAAAAARRNTSKEALRWGYVMNMGLDSFRAMFEKFAKPS